MDTVRKSLKNKLTKLHRSIANSETGKFIGFQRLAHDGISEDFAEQNDQLKELRAELKKLRDVIESEKQSLKKLSTEIPRAIVSLASVEGLEASETIGPNYFEELLGVQEKLSQEEFALEEQTVSEIDSLTGSIEYEIGRARHLKASYYRAVELHKQTLEVVDVLSKVGGRDASTTRMRVAQSEEQSMNRDAIRLQKQTLDRMLDIFAATDKLVLQGTRQLIERQLESKKKTSWDS